MVATIHKPLIAPSAAPQEARPPLIGPETAPRLASRAIEVPRAWVASLRLRIQAHPLIVELSLPQTRTKTERNMQRTHLIKATLAGVVAAVTLLLTGPAVAALQDRDLDGDSVVDAFYDTDLDITWLRDANVNGAKTWADAVAWAGNYSIGVYSDWRLPTALNADQSGPCAGFNCTSSEMGHLWYVELGNAAGGPMTNTGNFTNYQHLFPGDYWNATQYTPDACCAWMFRSANGLQTTEFTSDLIFAMAVRDGDVTPIPEPQTYALMLLGLGAGTLVVRRRRH